MKKIICLFILYLVLPSCSIRQIAVLASSDIVNSVQISFMQEKDPQLAKEAFPGLIKIAEGMHAYYPKSPYYSGKLCFLLSAYAFAYIDESPYSDYDDDSELKEKRLLEYYKRAYDFGLLSLSTKIPNFSQLILSQPELALKKIKVRDIETLFWFNFAWAMMIFNNTADAKLVLQLKTIKQIADKIMELKPDYLNYAIYGVYVAYYGGRSKTIGGNPDKALAYYQKGLQLANNNSILNFIYYKYVSTQTSDSKTFEELYERIIEFDPNTDLDNLFIHKIIQTKAKQLYLKKTEIF